MGENILTPTAPVIVLKSCFTKWAYKDMLLSLTLKKNHLEKLKSWSNSQDNSQQLTDENSFSFGLAFDCSHQLSLP